MGNVLGSLFFQPAGPTILPISGANGKMKTIQRHLLVITTFKFNTYKSGTQIFHLDGNKLNNNVDNLVFFYKYYDKKQKDKH